MSDEHRVNALATYNGERGRGIVHSPEWIAFMEGEQRWFTEEYMPASWKRMGYEPVPGDGPFTVYRKVKRSVWQRLGLAR